MANVGVYERTVVNLNEKCGTVQMIWFNLLLAYADVERYSDWNY